MELNDKEIRDALYNFVMTTSNNPEDYPDLQLFRIMQDLVERGAKALQIPVPPPYEEDTDEEDETMEREDYERAYGPHAATAKFGTA
ncbi:hypothetical protein KGP36_01760 [Patescibacteria group bacterium]|nr:hypothetical protein [Patescibacteria group bacterium]